MASRLAGKEIPKMEDNETTIEDLRTRLNTTIAFLESFVESDFTEAATAEARWRGPDRPPSVSV